MLKDPVNDVLNPLTLEESKGQNCPAVLVENAPGNDIRNWKELKETVISCGGNTLPIGEFITALPTAVPDGADYQKAYEASLSGNHQAAAGEFMRVALLGGPEAIAALYGLAVSIAHLGRNARAEKMALFVAKTPGFDDPRAYALAGFCAFNRKAAKIARVHLAKSTRLARRSTDYRTIQKFAQRILLVQQFGSSGEAD